MDAAPLAAVPVAPGNSDLCFRSDDPIDAAVDHLREPGTAGEAGGRIEVGLGRVERFGARGAGTSVYFRDPDGSLLEFITYT